MAARIISQKRFSKLAASTGPLAQPPGAVTRVSNLLFTTRGSLQIADGSVAIADGFNAAGHLLSIAPFAKSNTTLGIGQYPPVITFITQQAAASLSGVTGVAATPNTGGSNPNTGLYYQFAVVALDVEGGTTSVGTTGAWVNINALSPFDTVTVAWTNLVGNQGYQVWYLGFSFSTPLPAPYAGLFGYLLGTVATDVVTFTSSSGLLPNPNALVPWLNSTQPVFLEDLYYKTGFGYTRAYPGTTLSLSNHNIFPASAPQPASAQIGDPNFSPSTIVPGYTPYGGILGQACPIPTQVQFAGQTIVLLGNGLPPLAYDPSTGIAPNAPAVLTNSFTAAYPSWQASVSWLTGSLVTDGAGNYFEATQGGVSGATAPAWNTTLGDQTPDGTVLWTSKGPIVATTAPRGAAHAVAYAGSLWLANTYPTTTSDGIDGPTCLKMSDANNPNSWNPINTAFIGKNDGTQITGLQPFTIAALGISPTGSLCVFKEFQTYQVIGVFGSMSFEIQPAQTNLGCLAARSIQFVPGFGVVRFSHLGFAVFNGIEDRLISEDIRPYLFGGVDSESDLTPVDPTFVYRSVSAQTITPPMYLCAMPLTGASGAMTRLFCYDLVMKSWTVLDLPWAISSMATMSIGEGYPLVLAGKEDGTIQRLQSSDVNWDQGDSAQSAVDWSFRSPDVFAEGSTQRMFYEMAIIRGYGSATMVQSIIANLWMDGQQIGAQAIDVVPQGGSNLFEARVKIFKNGYRAHLDISGNNGGAAGTIDAIDWSVAPKAPLARRIIG